ncbi:MAG: hypothetical protein H6704_14365 [Myxococcales bacterium]|nr:hypothetical protein [Myxococcales bacterium]
MKLREELLLDKRLIERHIQRGLISREDYDKHLADLADKKATSVAMKVEVSSVGVGKVSRADDGEHEG